MSGTIPPHQPPAAPPVTPHQVSTGAAHEMHAHSGAIGEERLFEALRARLVDFKTLSNPLRAALALALVALLLLGAIMLLHDSGLPFLNMLPFEERQTRIPTTALVVGFFALGLAWTFALVGAFRAHWSVRLLVLLLYSVTQGLGTLPGITESGWILFGAIVDLSALTLLWLWGLITVVLDLAYSQQDGSQTVRSVSNISMMLSEKEQRDRVIMLITICLAPLSFVGSTVSEMVTDISHPGFNFMLAALTLHLFALFGFLIPALMFAGTDTAEWGEVVASRAAFLAQRVRSVWALQAVALLLAIATLIDLAIDVSRRLQPTSMFLLLLLLLFPPLAAGAVAASAVHKSHILRWPPLGLPFGAPLGVAACYLVALFPSFLIGGKVMALFTATVLTLAIGGPILWGRRDRPGPMAMTGLLFTLFGCYSFAGLLIAVLVGIFTLLRVPQIPQTTPEVLSLYGAQMLSALGTLFVLICLLLPQSAIGRRLAQREGETLTAPCVLDGGLLVLVWVTRLFASRAEANQPYALVPVIVLVGAFVWDFLFSGESVTNRHGPEFPREARVLMYAGYTLAVATAVIFFGSLTFTQTGEQAFAGMIEDTTWALLGAIILDVPVLLTRFVLQLPRERDDSPNAAHRAPQLTVEG